MLRVFGHAGNNKLSGKALSCSTTETIYGLHPYEGSLFDNSLSELKPTGWTPIAKALADTRKEFEAFDADGKNVVYLITDGEETCGGDPFDARSFSISAAGSPPHVSSPSVIKYTTFFPSASNASNSFLVSA